MDNIIYDCDPWWLLSYLVFCKHLKANNIDPSSRACPTTNTKYFVSYSPSWETTEPTKEEKQRIWKRVQNYDLDTLKDELFEFFDDCRADSSIRIESMEEYGCDASREKQLYPSYEKAVSILNNL